MLFLFVLIQIINLLPVPSSALVSRRRRRSTTSAATLGAVNKAYEHGNESSLTTSPAGHELNASDDEIKHGRILWLRNVTRIQMQVTAHEPHT